MKVYLSVDLEGINGVVHPYHVSSDGGEHYLNACKQQALEVETIVQALLECNISKITVNDAHNTMDNLNLQAVNPKVELITGKPKFYSMMAGLDSSYSCCFFVGYHSMAGSKGGVLAHTFSPVFNQVKLNGKPVGEIEINAIYAAKHNVPVVFLTGDNLACDEAEELLDGINTVSVKTAISTTSAFCNPNELVISNINSSVKKVFADKSLWKVYDLAPLYKLNLVFADRKHADVAELLPVVERISAYEIQFSSENYEDIYRMLQFFSATIK